MSLKARNCIILVKKFSLNKWLAGVTDSASPYEGLDRGSIPLRADKGDIMGRVEKSLYMQDYYKWCKVHVDLIRAKDFENMDWERIEEEMVNMVGNNEGELENRLIVLYAHLLKWIYQPTKRGKSWTNSIGHQRDSVPSLINRNPSLKSSIEECSIQAYKRARKQAARETGLKIKNFPEEMPFTVEQALDEEWLPK